MKPTKFRILSAITAGSLALAGLTALAVSSGPGHAAQPGTLAAQTEPFPPVNIDECPILHTGYPIGGCVAQLQEDLNHIAGNNNLTVDGDFGPVNSQTYQAVTAFQGSHGLTQDGLVGPETKKALDAAVSMSTPGVVPSATGVVPSATASAPGTSSANPAPATSSGNPVVINCGYATCSAYLSRSVTRAAYQKSTVGQAGYEAAALVICAPLLAPPLTPLGVACGAVATVQGGWIAQELHDAVTQHGAGGACLKLTYTRPVGLIPPTITWWSTNNGQYCTD